MAELRNREARMAAKRMLAVDKYGGRKLRTRVKLLASARVG